MRHFGPDGRLQVDECDRCGCLIGYSPVHMISTEMEDGTAFLPEEIFEQLMDEMTGPDSERYRERFLVLDPISRYKLVTCKQCAGYLVWLGFDQLGFDDGATTFLSSVRFYGKELTPLTFERGRVRVA